MARRASPAQIAARKRFAAMARSGAWKKNPKRKARKNRKRRKARRNPPASRAQVRAAMAGKGKKHPKAHKPYKGAKRGRRRSGAKRSRASAAMKKLRAQLKSASRGYKRMKPRMVKKTYKRGKRKGQTVTIKRYGRARTPARTRIQYLKARIGKRRVAKGKGGAALVKKYGLARINPSGMLAQVQALLPELATGVGSVVLSVYGGSMLAKLVADKAPALIPAGLKPHVPAMATMVVGGLAYVGLNMSGSAKAKQLAPWALGGGLIAAVLQEIGALKASGVLPAWMPSLSGDGIFGEYVMGDYHVGDYHIGDGGVGDYHIGAHMLTAGGGARIPIQGDGIFGAVESIVMDPSRRMEAPASEMVRHDVRRDGVDASVESYFGGSLQGDIFGDSN